jgi:hypothetical protein
VTTLRFVPVGTRHKCIRADRDDDGDLLHSRLQIVLQNPDHDHVLADQVKRVATGDRSDTI